MTTATTTTALDHTTDAGYNTWVSEIITLLFTTLGLTQTTDTGQTTGSGLTRPSTNSVNAYIVGRFNDTAQSTNPIFFRLDFGTASSATIPLIRLTVGTGSNGSGTINGVTTLTGVALTQNNTASSSINAYVTRACYNATLGVFWLAWKVGSNTTYPNASMGGLAIIRSADNTAAVTTDSTLILTNGNNANSIGAQSSSGYAQVISHLTSAAYTTTPWPSIYHSLIPFNITTTIYGGNAQISPAFQYTPVIGITPWWGLVLNSELGVGSTTSATLVGSTAHTYINAGNILGCVTSFGTQSLTSSTWGMLMLWE